MSDLMPYNDSQPIMRRTESRQLGRALGRLNADVSIQTARIEAAAEVQAIRADAVTYVAKRAMQDIAMLTQLEQQLAVMVPLASGRLAAIGDMTALALTDVVTDTLRRLR